jgi:eukaryotic-like serine/threonine-protein kinase
MSTWQVVLSVINGDLRGRAYVFERPSSCVIGRSKDCDIGLSKTEDFAGISRHHCQLEIKPPHVSVRDLGSLNGTYVNNERIGGRTAHMKPEQSSVSEYVSRQLRNDDVLRVGDIHFRVSIIEPSLVAGRPEAAPLECA